MLGLMAASLIVATLMGVVYINRAFSKEVNGNEFFEYLIGGIFLVYLGFGMNYETVVKDTTVIIIETIQEMER